MTSALEELFVDAVALIRSSSVEGAIQIDNDTRLRLYGLYKVATEGICELPPPSLWAGVVARVKWSAWRDCVAQNSSTAKVLYVKEIGTIMQRCATLPEEWKRFAEELRLAEEQDREPSGVENDRIPADNDEFDSSYPFVSDEAVMKAFDRTTHLIDQLPSSLMHLSISEKLRFYGLYKQGKYGVCDTVAPAIWNVPQRAKWNAWKELLDCDPKLCQRDYILGVYDIVKALDLSRTRPTHRADIEAYLIDVEPIVMDLSKARTVSQQERPVVSSSGGRQVSSSPSKQRSKHLSSVDLDLVTSKLDRLRELQVENLKKIIVLGSKLRGQGGNAEVDPNRSDVAFILNELEKKMQYSEIDFAAKIAELETKMKQIRSENASGSWFLQGAAFVGGVVAGIAAASWATRKFRERL